MWRLIVGMMSSIVDVHLLNILSLSKYLTIVVAKKKPVTVSSNTASSSQTKCTVSIVIDGDTEDEDIRHLF